MSIKNAEKFYKQDKKKYILSKNREFLNWLKEAIKLGYEPFININELQDLIDTITSWYEFKYPDKELDNDFINILTDFENIESLTSVMNTKQLMYRLSNTQLFLINCNYRAKTGGFKTIKNDNGETTGFQSIVFFTINSNDDHNSFFVQADRNTGMVLMDDELRKRINRDNINLDELLLLFKVKYSEELDFKALEKCVYDHKWDLELRQKILELVALKLLYSKKTTPEIGYKRALKFINEFNTEINLNLSTEEINNKININDIPMRKMNF